MRQCAEQRKRRVRYNFSKILLMGTQNTQVSMLSSPIFLFFNYPIPTPDRRQSKTLILSTNVDQKSLETKKYIRMDSIKGYRVLNKAIDIINFAEHF